MPTKAEVLASKIQQYEAQITNGQNANIENAITKLAAAQTASGGGTSDIRDSAVRIEQTINPTGSVTAVKYIMSNGDTIEDTFTYGANSVIEPIIVNRGSLVKYV